MKLAALFLVLAATTPAFAAALAQDKPLCIDASQTDRYNARPISQHEVLARNAFGHDHRAARLATTCIHIYPDSFVALHSMTTCVSIGDDISVRTIDGHGELCRITAVRPSAQSYGDAKYGPG